MEANKLYCSSTLLDPRYKKEAFRDKGKSVCAKNNLIYEISESLRSTTEPEIVEANDEGGPDQNEEVDDWENIFASAPASSEEEMVDVSDESEVVRQQVMYDSLQ